MTMKKPAALLLVTVLCLGAGISVVRATDLFDNGTVQVSGVKAAGYVADQGSPNFIEAGNIFTPTQSGTADTISFAGFYLLDKTGTSGSNLITNDFTLDLRAVTGTSADYEPGAVIGTSGLTGLMETNLGTSSDGYTIFGFSGTLTNPTPFGLTAGTEYYLGISDGTNDYQIFCVDDAVAPGITRLEKSYDIATDPPSFQGGDGAIYFDLNQEDVPEPSSFALLGLGGLALGWVLRRRTIVG
jgi:hypothetical protein